MADTPNAYTIKQLADEKQLCPATVRRLILAGELKAVKWGRSWRIPREAVEEFESRNTASDPSQGVLSCTSFGPSTDELRRIVRARRAGRKHGESLRNG